MRKSFAVASLLILLSVSLMSPGFLAADGGGTEWTIMIYMAGGVEESISTSIARDLEEIESAGYSARYRILILKDGDRYGDSEVLTLTEGGLTYIDLSEVNGTWSDELNMADWRTLRDFVSWGLEKYPSDHTMLIFWGHGRGWMGMPADEGYDILTFSAVSQALGELTSTYGKLDIIGFDQCNMAMFEVFCEISDFAEYAIASEKEEDLRGWPYDIILAEAHDSDNLTPEDFSRLIVRDSISWARNNSVYSSTLSAVNLSRMEEVSSALHDYVSTLKMLLPNYKLEMARSRDNAENYDKQPYPYDLYNLTENLEENIDFPELEIRGKALRDAINDTVIAEAHYKTPRGMSVEGAHGISIWFPSYGTNTGYEKFRGVADAGWADFLDTYYRSVPGERPPLHIEMTERDGNGDGANERFYVEVSGNGTLGIKIFSGDEIVRQNSGNYYVSLDFYSWKPGYYRILVYSMSNDSIRNYSVLQGVIETVVTIRGRITDSSGKPMEATLTFHFDGVNVSTEAKGDYSLDVISPELVRFGDRVLVTIDYGDVTETRYVWINSTGITADFFLRTENYFWAPYLAGLLLFLVAVLGALLVYDREEKRKRRERLKSEVKIGKVKIVKKVIKVRTFIDREEELAELSTALKRAMDGVGSTIFLTGEDGVGKRALMNRFRKESGVRFVSYESSGRERKPYAPLIKVLESLNSLGIVSVDINGIISMGSKEQALEEGFQTCIEASREVPLIVYFSSAQWLDPGTIEFLEYFARGIEETKVILVISAPQEELEDIGGKPHPLNAMLMSLMMEGKIRMIKLERFDRERTGTMLSIILDAEITDDILDKIYEETQGLPILIEEIANRIRATGKSIYELEDSDIEIPKNVRELLGKRVERIKGEERSLAEWASVLGTRFSLEVLEAICGGGERFMDLIYGLIEDKILVEEGDEYRFDHPQLQAILYDSLGERAKEMHLKAGETMERMNSDDVYSLAHHFCAAGIKEKCLKYSLEAAKKAERTYSPSEAIKYYRMAEKNAESSLLPEIYLNMVNNLRKIMEVESAEEYAKKAAASGGKIAGRAHLLLGHIYMESSRWEEAKEEYRKAMDSHIKEVVIDAYRGLGKVYWRLGEHEKAAENLQKAMELAKETGNSNMLGIATIDLANVYSNWGKYPQAIRLYEEAIKILESVGNLSEISRAYNNLGEIYKYEGDMEKAIESYMKCVDYAERTKDMTHVGYGVENMGTVYTYMGRFEEATEYLSKAYRIFSKTDDKYMISGIYMAYGIMFRMQKKWEKAEENFLKSIELLRDIGIKYDLGITIYEYGKMLREKGDERAESVLNEALRIFQELGSEHYIQLVKKELEEIGR